MCATQNLVAAITLIIKKRVPNVFHVNTYLVCASCFKNAFNQSNIAIALVRECGTKVCRQFVCHHPSAVVAGLVVFRAWIAQANYEIFVHIVIVLFLFCCP